ncbi:MAG: tRNA 2-thiouridine(34) synthase MnmA [Planctomycetota bacterium]
MSLVVLAMSGGVDSSVAAHLLLARGHEVIGVFMRHGEQSPAACASSPTSSPQAPAPSPQPPAPAAQLPIAGSIVNGRLDHKQGCCTAADAEDARRVSDRLGIPFYALDLNAEFAQIMDYFVDEYARGRTPNPCVQCNNWIKFGKLFEYADSVNAEFVATGHYARLADSLGGRGGERALLRGVDAGKDQSYVLAGIRRELLPRMLLPVGGFEKPRIREIAGGLGLNVAEKKDSQEICFVTSGRYDQFVKRRRPGNQRVGELVTTDGTVVGTHDGIEGFTVGQRKGLGVALGRPVFVTRIEAETNRVVLGDREEMLCPELTASDCNWLVDPPTGEPVRCQAQIRYNAPAAPAVMQFDGDTLSVRFDEPQFGVAPGQAVVCYDGDRVLGGGWID